MREKTIVFWSMGLPLKVPVLAIQAVRPDPRKPETACEILIGGMFIRIHGRYQDITELLKWDVGIGFNLPEDATKWTGPPVPNPEPVGKIPLEPVGKIPLEPVGKIPPEPVGKIPPELTTTKRS